MGRSSTRKNQCSFRGVTLKRETKPLQLPKSFDLHDLRYKAPTRKDLAVGLVFFNSSKSKRLLMNYLYIAEKLKVAGIPFYTLEMYTDTHEIHDAFHYKTDFILFQKERLCYLLEKQIPASFTKLLFMDCDLVFQNVNWYDELSDKLDSFEIVQPFSKAVWLDITYTRVIQERLPILFYNKLGGSNENHKPIRYHAGFAWAFQRPWFQRIGFFSHSILGGGDSFSSSSWMRRDIQYKIPCLENVLREFKASIVTPPTMCFLNGVVFHLWHGDLGNRQYDLRWNLLKDCRDIREIVTIAPNGLFTLKNDALKPRIKHYFKGRDDDGIAAP